MNFKREQNLIKAEKEKSDSQKEIQELEIEKEENEPDVSIEKPDSGCWFPKKADESKLYSGKADKVKVVKKLNKVMVTKKYIDLREKDTTASEVIGYIEVGVELKVTGKTNHNWLEVKFGNSIGYIDSSLLTDKKADKNNETEVENIETSEVKKDKKDKSLSDNKKADTKAETPKVVNKKADVKTEIPKVVNKKADVKTEIPKVVNKKADKKSEAPKKKDK